MNAIERYKIGLFRGNPPDMELTASAIPLLRTIDLSAPPVSDSCRLPPYGREVLEFGRTVQCYLNLFIFAGKSGWRRAIARRTVFGPGTALVFPVGMCWWDYNWPVSRQFPLIVWPDAEHHDLVDFGAYLVACGADKVVALAPSEPGGALWLRRVEASDDGPSS